MIKENEGGLFADINEQVVFVYLPPYSPDLSPIEQVWRVTRRDAKNNKYFPGKAELELELDDFYAILATPNSYLRSLCSFSF